jgi:hypothetical protein
MPYNRIDSSQTVRSTIPTRLLNFTLPTKSNNTKKKNYEKKTFSESGTEEGLRRTCGTHRNPGGLVQRWQHARVHERH